MADDADIFTLEIQNSDGTKFGGNTRVTDRVVAKPKTDNNFKLVDVFDHRIFANEINDALKEKLPFVYIEEFSLISNSLINQFRYFGDIIRFDDVLNNAKRVANDVTSNDSVKSGIDAVAGWIKTAADFTGVKLPDVGERVNSVGKRVNDIASTLNPSKLLPYVTTQLKESTFDEQLVGSSLKPYNGLYQTKPTGFKYIMPYFDNKNYDINNKFTDNFTGFMGIETQPLKSLPNIFKAGADMVKTVGETFLSLPSSIGGGGAYNSPSTYVETPQYFTAGEYDTYTVKFDLLNTFSFEDVQKNYDLLFLLAFQNLPYREDIAKIVPPKLYTLLIPGQIFLPYCHIKSIKVDYVGNRRQLNIKKFCYRDKDVVKEEQNIIVPDCYKVTIEFLSMVKPASNFMLVPDIRSVYDSPLTTITSAEVINNEQPTPTPTPVPVPTPVPSVEQRGGGQTSAGYVVPVPVPGGVPLLPAGSVITR